MKPNHSAALWLIAYVMAYCCACVYFTHSASEEATNRAMAHLATAVQRVQPLRTQPAPSKDSDPLTVSLAK